MTIDNVVSKVYYDNVQLQITGDVDVWHQVKTFSFTAIAGAELEISGYESANCNGCSCSGFLFFFFWIRRVYYLKRKRVIIRFYFTVSTKPVCYKLALADFLE